MVRSCRLGPPFTVAKLLFVTLSPAARLAAPPCCSSLSTSLAACRRVARALSYSARALLIEYPCHTARPAVRPDTFPLLISPLSLSSLPSPHPCVVVKVGPQTSTGVAPYMPAAGHVLMESVWILHRRLPQLALLSLRSSSMAPPNLLMLSCYPTARPDAGVEVITRSLPPVGISSRAINPVLCLWQPLGSPSTHCLQSSRRIPRRTPARQTWLTLLLLHKVRTRVPKCPHLSPLSNPSVD